MILPCHIMFRGFIQKQLHISLRYFNKLRISEEVQWAKYKGTPVIALETALLTHGLSYPDNFRIMKEMSQIIRSGNAVPAITAVLDGNLVAGLDDAELDYLTEISQGNECWKLTSRDLPLACSLNISGGTTVSSTCQIASMSGIKLFATGGIGGVHYGKNFDISSDLFQLTKSHVAVISSGVKSFLNLPHTLEFLETFAVPVLSAGSSKFFPGFLKTVSDVPSPAAVSDIRFIAAAIVHHFELSSGGILIANSLPTEYELPATDLKKVYDLAEQDVQSSNVSGKDVTPAMLDRMNFHSAGKTKLANLMLLRNNAKFAVKISQHMPQQFFSTRNIHYSTFCSPDYQAGRSVCITVVGGSTIDSYVSLTGLDTSVDPFHVLQKMPSGSFRGKFWDSCGGVGMNVARFLDHLNADITFVTALGSDSNGKRITSSFRKTRILYPETRLQTSQFIGLLHEGTPLFYVGNWDIFQEVTQRFLERSCMNALSKSNLICLDGNLPASTLSYIIEFAHFSDIPVLYDPTDPSLCKNLKNLEESLSGISFITPNITELFQLFDTLTEQSTSVDDTPDIEFKNLTMHTDFKSLKKLSIYPKLPSILSKCSFLSKNYFRNIILTLGEDGVILFQRKLDNQFIYQPLSCFAKDEFQVLHYPASRIIDVVNSSGAGDCFLAGFAYQLSKANDIDICMKSGIRAASLSLTSQDPVPSADTVRATDFSAAEILAHFKSSSLPIRFGVCLR